VRGRNIWMPRDAVQQSMRESSPAVFISSASDVANTGYSHDLHMPSTSAHPHLIHTRLASSYSNPAQLLKSVGAHQICCMPPSGRGGGLIHTFGMICMWARKGLKIASALQNPVDKIQCMSCMSIHILYGPLGSSGAQATPGSHQPNS